MADRLYTWNELRQRNVIKKLVKDKATLIAQRDDLLAAIQAVLEHLAGPMDRPGDTPIEECARIHNKAFYEAIQEARAICAKAKGEA